MFLFYEFLTLFQYYFYYFSSGLLTIFLVFSLSLSILFCFLSLLGFILSFMMLNDNIQVVLTAIIGSFTMIICVLELSFFPSICRKGQGEGRKREREREREKKNCLCFADPTKRSVLFLFSKISLPPSL